MILARISRAIREQNWFAVAIELVIVIAGVVIGFQVSNWASYQGDRRDEHQILVRLLNEADALAENRAETREFAERRTDILTAAREIIFLQEDDRQIDEVMCQAIVASHIYRQPPNSLPTLEEILSTGQLSLIRNAEVKLAISSFLLMREESRNFSTSLNNDLFRLANLHPELITQTMERTDDPDAPGGLRRRYFCHLNAMRTSHAFRNDFLDNSARYDAFVRWSLRFVDSELDALRETLRAEVGSQEVAP